MVIRCALFFGGVLVGALSCVLASTFLKPKPPPEPIPQAIKLTNGNNFSVVSDPYVVITGKTGDHLEVVLCKHDKECFVINAEAEAITFQSSSYEQGLKVTLLDTDGDGIPDLKIYSQEDGTTIRTQLFFNGEFQDAQRGEKGWEIGTTSVVFKDHKWQPAGLSDH